MKQKTLKKEMNLNGVGLHSGDYCKVIIFPAPVDTGIVFRTQGKNISICADIEMVTDTLLSTTIGDNRITVKTVEHLLATFSALGISNVMVKMDGTEMPILDGSAKEIVREINKAGIAEQEKDAHFIKIKQPIYFGDDNSFVKIMPYEFPKRHIKVFLEFINGLPNQSIDVEIEKDTFTNDIAPARTFGFFEDFEKIRSIGLAKGANFDNVLIYKDMMPWKTQLRFKDECVRHKILDIMGDFLLTGYPIQGQIIAHNSGHTTNMEALKKLLSNPDIWTLE